MTNISNIPHTTLLCLRCNAKIDLYAPTAKQLESLECAYKGACCKDIKYALPTTEMFKIGELKSQRKAGIPNDF